MSRRFKPRTAADFAHYERADLVRVIMRSEGQLRTLRTESCGGAIADLVEIAIVLAERKRMGKLTAGDWERFYGAVEGVVKDRQGPLERKSA